LGEGASDLLRKKIRKKNLAGKIYFAKERGPILFYSSPDLIVIISSTSGWSCFVRTIEEYRGQTSVILDYNKRSIVFPKSQSISVILKQERETGIEKKIFARA
jgi:hypothetical protein